MATTIATIPTATVTNNCIRHTGTTTLVIEAVADTSGLISLLVDIDADHEKALALSTLFDESPGAVIISSHVFTELMNVLGKKLGAR